MKKSDEKILQWNGVTRLDYPVRTITADADKADLEEIAVAGFDKEGMFYFSSSKADGGAVLWLLEKAKQMLLNYEV